MANIAAFTDLSKWQLSMFYAQFTQMLVNLVAVQ